MEQGGFRMLEALRTQRGWKHIPNADVRLARLVCPRTLRLPRHFYFRIQTTEELLVWS
jgi:hypothetical protein